MHSPEPWKAHPYSGPAPNFRLFTILDADNKTFYASTSGQTVEQSLANVERIVACVKFCRGISTKDLQLFLGENAEELRQGVISYADDIVSFTNRMTMQSSPSASQQPG